MELCRKLNLARSQIGRVVERSRRSEERVISQHASVGRGPESDGGQIGSIHRGYIRTIEDVESFRK